MARLAGIQMIKNFNSSRFLCELDQNLNFELQNIVVQERQYWTMKSRINLLKYGDANTSFFHTSTLKMRRANKIHSLRNKASIWISSFDTLKSLTCNHFKEIYTTFAAFSINYNILLIHPLYIHFRDIQNPLKPSSENDIKISINSFKPRKAPGSDGLHDFFFHKYITNTSIINLFHVINVTGVFPSNLNKTFIAIIPKVLNPETINQFRPINLCDSIYKIFAKIIVNQLRPLVDVFYTHHSSLNYYVKV